MDGQVVRHILGDIGWHFQFLLKGCPNFLQDVWAQQQLMLIDTHLHKRVTQTLGSESGDQNVRVQDNLHEMLRNTSSSVRIPWASAKGRTVLRSFRKL